MHIRLAASLVLLAALTACGGAVRTVAYHFPLNAATARLHLHDAGSTGPVLLEVRDNPFAADAARPYAEAASRTVMGLGTVFTADRAAAARPEYRVVVEFNPGGRVTASEVCDRRSTIAQERAPDRLTTLTVFCHGTQSLLSVAQVAPPTDRPDSPVVRSLAQEAMFRLFPPDALKEPDDYWPD